MSETDRDFTVNPQKIEGKDLYSRFARGVQKFFFGVQPKTETTVTPSAQASKPTAGK